jgi:RNA polymerase sigma factor (sigma-70 family)
MSGVHECAEFQRMVDRLKERDALAFAEFCDWFEQPLMRKVRAELFGGCLSWIDPADICQEVLIGFWQACPRLAFSEAPSVERYLFKMARSKILDAIRHSRVGCQDATIIEPLAAGIRDPICPDGTPDAAVSIREFEDRAGERLSDLQRKICYLRCQAMDWIEIARCCGMSVGAAQKQFRRACDCVMDDVYRDDSAYVARRRRCREPGE